MMRLTVSKMWHLRNTINSFTWHTRHTSETHLYKTQRGQELIFGDNIMNEIKVATKTPVYIRCVRLFEI